MYKKQINCYLMRVTMRRLYPHTSYWDGLLLMLSSDDPVSSSLVTSSEHILVLALVSSCISLVWFTTCEHSSSWAGLRSLEAEITEDITRSEIVWNMFIVVVFTAVLTSVQSDSVMFFITGVVSTDSTLLSVTSARLAIYKQYKHIHSYSLHTVSIINFVWQCLSDYSGLIQYHDDEQQSHWVQTQLSEYFIVIGG